jgi:hypothetical protein
MSFRAGVAEARDAAGPLWEVEDEGSRGESKPDLLLEDAGAEGACMNKSGGSNLEAASRGSWESVRKQGTDSIRVLGVHVELGWCKLRCSKRVAWDA